MVFSLICHKTLLDFNKMYTLLVGVTVWMLILNLHLNELIRWSISLDCCQSEVTLFKG